MKFIVDLDKCENHGQCTYLAPKVFHLDDNGELDLREGAGDEYVSGAIGEDLAEDVQEAADMCPVQAIRVES
ncbi:ferredoxin [Rhodococcus koreensis]